jgi:hypothetical protein
MSGNDERANFTVSKTNGDGRPKQQFAITLSGLKILAIVGAQLFGFMSGSFAIAHKVGSVMVERTISTALDKHNTAAAETHGQLKAENAALRERVSILEEHGRDIDARLIRIENMVWAIYTSQFGAAPPPSVPIPNPPIGSP